MSSRPAARPESTSRPVSGSVGVPAAAAAAVVVELVVVGVLGADAGADACVEGVVVVVLASTTIVPCMKGWIWQTYANVPAWVNVCDALWPCLRIPVLKLPLVAVAVCELGPLLVQVMVSPTCTVVALLS